MNLIFTFMIRNLKLYFRNKTAVFFSFLSIIIIIGLYALFLGKIQVDSIESSMRNENGELLVSTKDIGWLVNSWIMAGLLSVNAVTITLAALGRMVEDIERDLIKDFLSSPIKRTQLVLGYIASSWVLGFLMSAVGFAIIEGFILLEGGHILSIMSIIKTFLIIILSVISFSSFTFFILTYIKSSSAYATLSTIVGTLIGFLAGIYVPVGILPKVMQNFVSVFPVSYSASMLRQLFMEQPVEKVFGLAPNKDELIASYYQNFGVVLHFNGTTMSWTMMIMVLIIMAIFFYTLSVVRIVKNKLL